MWLKNDRCFGENFERDEGQVHVLVVVRKYVRANVGKTGSRASAYTHGRSSTYNASYLSFWQSLQSLVWPMETIPPTKKDV
ncbi:hypothetical protein PF007_g4467 [Phytophthora fragariae]|nr:hypothetical protein PF009_g4825 [Phytophthora fragariae]KAE9130572.1 hypothetical protein PF007_g4467 [Phytophthora fragariae]KAE9152153.1 hypothetical protein PF006_g3614 [Phytophthora fragariae]KAE9249033.1 hypothetical protein PF004_g3588 [Phytophthora fragariae]